MADTSRRLSPERRERILGAARHLILRQGLRPTTMEALAREAKVAKPTLYSYFPDKEAVFAALVQSLADDIRFAVGEAFESSTDAVTRIGSALVAKYDVVIRLLEGSPHADELYSEHDRSAARQFAAIEREIEDAIVATLKDAGVERPDALARLLLASAYGIGRKSLPSEIEAAMRLMVERLVRPELPPPA